MESSTTLLSNMICKVVEKLESIEVCAQMERQGIRDELRANRHLMSDLWMADSVQKMSNEEREDVNKGVKEKEDLIMENESKEKVPSCQDCCLLQDRLEELKLELEETKALFEDEESASKRTVESLSSTSDQLMTRLTAAEAEVQRLNEDLKQAYEKLLENQVEHVKEKSSLEKQLADEKQNTDFNILMGQDLMDNLDALKTRAQRLEKELRQVNPENWYLRGVLLKTEFSAKNFQAELEACKTIASKSRVDYRLEVQRLKDELTEVKTRNTKLQSEHDSTMASLQQQLESEKSSNYELNTVTGDLVSQLDESKAEIARLEESLINAGGMEHHLFHELMRSIGKCTDLEGELRSSRFHVGILEANIEDSSEAEGKMRADLEAKVQNLEVELKATLNKKQKLQAEHDNTKASLEQQLRDEKKLNNMLQTMTCNLETNLDNSTEKIRGLESELENVKSKYAKMSDDLAKTDDRCVTLEKKLASSELNLKVVKGEAEASKLSNGESKVNSEAKEVATGNNSIKTRFLGSIGGSGNNRQDLEINNAGPEAPTGDIVRVFIWDLDEPLILYNSLLQGIYAKEHCKASLPLLNLSQKMCELISHFVEKIFFHNDLQDCDQVHVDDKLPADDGQDLSYYDFESDGFRCKKDEICISTQDMQKADPSRTKKLSFRFRRIKEIYNKHRNDIGALLGNVKEEERKDILQQLEAHTDNWYSLALQCLMIPALRSNCINVVVSKTELRVALSKVAMFGLGPYFPAENVYSARQIGNETCIKKIMQRFGGPTSAYTVIGDGEDEVEAARKLSLPCCTVKNNLDLMVLKQMLNLELA